jgi:RsiW-degrading membrane proteinase PrsW (M82 family)
MFKSVFRNTASGFKITCSYIIGLLALLYCLYAAAADAHPVLQVLICIFGGAIGWCLGLYLTPSSDSEKKQFSEASKILLTLLSGFGLGKAQEIGASVKQWLPENKEAATTQVLLFLCCVLIGALFTYISRLFVRGAEEQQKEERAKTIKELKSALERLEQQNT